MVSPGAVIPGTMKIMADSNGVTKADLAALEERIMARFEGMHHYIDERTHKLRDYIDERTRDMQTELLRGFRGYQEGATIRMEKLSADVSNINVSTDKRIAIVEQRLAELERRIIEKGL